MIKRIVLATLALIFISMPHVTSAQTLSEAEYRAYLLTVIQNLQAQIAALQSSLNQSTVTIKPSKLDEETFTSFLIDADDVVAQYEITDIKEAQRLSNKTHQRFFLRFLEIVPDAYDDYFVDLLVFDGSNKDFDGFVETVPPYREDTWRIALNEDLFELTPTHAILDELFVHEFAHIISYERVVGVPEPYQTSCHEYFADFGCPPENAYLTTFIDEFWTNSDLNELLDSDGRSIWTKREIREYFVTEYASTDPAEDFAESFTAFILENKPSDTTLKSEKTRFFYEFEELAGIRKEIQDNL